MHEKLKQMTERAAEAVKKAQALAEATPGYNNNPAFYLELSQALSLAVIAANGIDAHDRLEFLERRERERSASEKSFCRHMEDLLGKGRAIRPEGGG